MTRIKSLCVATAISASLLFCLSGCGNSVAQQTQKVIAKYQGVQSVSAEKLKTAVEPLFENAEMAQTSAVIVMHGGKVVVERYAPGKSEQTRFISWSMGKTVTATLVGMMIADGRLALNQPAPIPAWQTPGDPRSKITIAHLLHMSAGLDHEETASEANGNRLDMADTPRMMFGDGRDNVAQYATGRTMEAAPGERFEYSTASTQILIDIMTRSLTESDDPEVRKREMLQYAKGRLFEPLGMSSAFAEFDRAGTMLGGSMIHATAPDWARFGEFLRNNGSVRSAQLLPTSWTKYMRTPSETDSSYGAQTWLNRERLPEGRPQNLFPDKAPADVFAALGHMGQFVIISPQHKLTIVRLGKTTQENLGPVKNQLAKIIALFPKN